VLALEIAPSGELWIGTQAGAFVYADNRFRLIPNTDGLGITAILFSAAPYLGTDNGNVLRVVSDEGGAIKAENLLRGPLSRLDNVPLAVTSLVETNGILLVATSGRGVFSVKDGNLSVVHTPPSPGVINALTIGNGSNWLGTDAPKGTSGIYRAAGGQRLERIAAATGKVLALETNDGGLWAGTERFGLFHVLGGKIKKAYTFENTSGGLRSNTVYTLFTDREGVLWIGTNRGVSRFDRLGASQETISDIANSNFIRTLFQAREDWTLAGSNRGLFLSEGEVWKPVPSFDGKVVHAIAEHKNTELMVGTAGALFDLSGNLILTGDIRAFANFRSRTYAAVYGRGVVSVPAGSRGFGLSPSLGSPAFALDASVTAICDGTERLWIGTADHGLFSFDGQTVKIEIGPDVLKSGTIWKMFSGSNGALWIAGEHGVFLVRDGQAEKIIEAEGVRDVFVDGDNVWAATTTRGLLQARYHERFGWLVSAVGFEQGLPSDKAFSIIPVSNGLLVATNRGVVTYRPGSVAPKLIPTRILSKRAHDLSEITSTIALEYPQNSLLIEVAGQSSRTFPEEFQYAFVLTNAKGDEIGRRITNESQYSPENLTPGEYVIEAIAFNRDLLASDPLTIRFSVAKAPFPWTATALGVLLLVALAGLVWAVIEHRRISHRNRELATARLELANEAERERRRISRDLHDQTLADLRSLMLKSDSAKPSIAGFRDEIEAISGEVRRICEDLSPSVLENVGLVAALEFLLKDTIEKHRFAAPSNIEDELTFPMQVQLQVYRIAQEVLANIKRHSNAGFVEMSLDYTEDEFVLRIEDDGDGFDPANAAKPGRGIGNIKARTSMIAGSAEWTKRRQGGNRFSLRIPK
jgi:signal transduction histidine kinase/ligand-binding sensor domain-containing protein